MRIHDDAEEIKGFKIVLYLFIAISNLALATSALSSRYGRSPAVPRNISNLMQPKESAG